MPIYDVTGVLLSIKSRCELQTAFGALAKLCIICSASIPVTYCHSRKAHDDDGNENVTKQKANEQNYSCARIILSTFLCRPLQKKDVK